MNKTIIENVESYILSIFYKYDTTNHPYHDLQHTIEVVKQVNKIGIESGLSQEDLELLTIAAWFHDVGYFTNPGDHEKESSIIAEKYLTSINYPKSKREQIRLCIKATKMPQQPKTLLEKVICDADLHHLGKTYFEERNELFRIEQEKRTGKSLTESEWLKNNVDFLREHKFFTDYALENYAKQKKLNLSHIQKKLPNIK